MFYSVIVFSLLQGLNIYSKEPFRLCKLVSVILNVYQCTHEEILEFPFIAKT